MMKNIFKGAVVSSVFLLLAACGNSTEENTDTDTISVWVQFSEEEAEGQVMANSIEEFNDTNEDGLTAEVQYIPRSGSGGGYEDNINAALTTDTLPDVLTVDGPNTAAYASSDTIQSLDGYISDLDDFLPSIIEQGTVEDELYSVGYSESGVGIYYNIDMLEEAGIETDSLPTVDEPWNWNEFDEMLSTVHSYYNQPVLDMGFDDQSEWLLYAFSPFIWSAGGDIVSEDGTQAVGIYDSTENVTVFEFIQQLVENEYSTISPVTNGFHTGEYALMMSGSWTMQELDNEYQDINYGIMPYPVSPETNELVSSTGSWAYAMSSSTSNPEGAGKLIDFLVNEQQLYNMSMGNSVLPARQSVADRMIEEVGEPMQLLIEQNVETGRARPSLVNYPQVSRTVQETVTESTYYEQTDDIQGLLEGKAQEIEGYLE